MKQFFVLALSLPALTSADVRAQGTPPLLGAQIWIEPGQRPEDVERWFKTLADARMPVARLFLMWNYVERGHGRHQRHGRAPSMPPPPHALTRAATPLGRIFDPHT